MTQDNRDIPLIGVSRQNYETLSRIADDFDMSIKDVADSMILQGLKWSSFRVYVTKGKHQERLGDIASIGKQQGATA